MTLDGIEDGVLAILIFILIVMPIAGFFATYFLWNLWRSDTHRPRSWILFALAISATIIEIMSLPIAWLSVRRVLFGQEALDPLLGGLLLGGILAVLEAVPVYFAATVYRQMHLAQTRRRRVDDQSSTLPEVGLLSADEPADATTIQ